jgi:uncharacterized protein involved in cysteine biosynthesis
MTRFQQFKAGFAAALRGMGDALRNPAVTRAYRNLALVIVAITVVLQFLMVWGLWSLTADWGQPGEGFWRTAQEWLCIVLRWAGTAVALLVAPLVALFLTQLVAPVLTSKLFLAALKNASPERAAALENRKGLPFGQSIAIALIRLATFLALTLVAFMVSFVPFIGPFIGPLAQFWLTLRFLGWELLDPYFDRLEIDLPEQRRYVKRHSAALLGFSVPAALVLGIPFAGPLLFAFLQAATATLIVDVLEPGKPAAEASPARAPG